MSRPGPASTDSLSGTRPATEIHAGLMSGTSLDGVDGVLIAFDANGQIQRTLASASLPMPEALRQQLTTLQHPGPDELALAARAANALTDLYAACVDELLTQSNLPTSAITTIGAHGQTVRHSPTEGYSLQLLNGARLAARTGIDVIADLRSADIANGGQGAPLMPAFHAHVFATHPGRYGILNLGGIANLTLIDNRPRAADSVLHVTGFDTGPANTLMDAWIEHHHGLRFDADGQWAASGQIIPPLLTRLLADPYFSQPAPKSTGRDLFNLHWLSTHLDALQNESAPYVQGSSQFPISSPIPTNAQAASDAPLPAGFTLHSPADVQATLLALTAESTAQAIRSSLPDAVYVCGGGARNACLIEDIQARVGPQIPIRSTDALGIPPQAVEATGFAWLARQRVHHQPIALQGITGARQPSILGAWHKASPPGP